MTAHRDFFQVGGTLSEDAPSYIDRSADTELLEALARHDVCLVLAPRQMGKSSLMVRTVSRLKEKGTRSAVVDLQPLGSERDASQWYCDVLYQMERSLALEMDTAAWWRAHSQLGVSQRFILFMENVAAAAPSGGVVVFFDEIDSVLRLPFSDDFFTTIRSLYNSRATNSTLSHVSFVLLGVASPSSFVADRSRTPFNIGTTIQLSDFDRADIRSLAGSLGFDDRLVDRIYYWTGGQPFLVQQLMAAVASLGRAERGAQQIDRHVQESYFQRTIEQDTHLKFISDYLLDPSTEVRQTLWTYLHVLRGRTVVFDERSHIQSHLRLAGVVRVSDGRLAPRNRIYERVFHTQWAQRNMPARFDGRTLWLSNLSITIVIVIASIVLGLVHRERQQVQALVDQVFTVELGRVPGVVSELKGHGSRARDLLEELKPEQPLGEEDQQLRYAMAMLPYDSRKMGDLIDRMLEPGAGGKGVFIVIRSYLQDYRHDVIPELWKRIQSENDSDKPTNRPEKMSPRFLAACALALYDSENHDWSKHAEFVSGELVEHLRFNLNEYDYWIACLNPIREWIREPLLDISRDMQRTDTERLLATSILVEYGSDQYNLLAEAIEYSNDYQFAKVLSVLQNGSDDNDLAAAIEERLSNLYAGHTTGAKASTDETPSVARRRASLAVALYMLGKTEKTWENLPHSSNPDTRSYVVHMLARLNASPNSLIDRLRVETDESARRAILLSLGGFNEQQLSLAGRSRLIPRLLRMYRDHPDPGVHGATEWLLRKWGQKDQICEIDEKLATGAVEEERRWYVNRQMQTMVILDAQVFRMGAPNTEPDFVGTETLHSRHIGRKLAIANKEITRTQVERFLKDVDWSFPFRDKFGPYTDGPQVSVTYYVAARYCNWLSKQEGIPEHQWCYRPNDSGDYAEGMAPVPGYLSLAGYRLPTEAEWEFACRAGASTSRYFGEDPTLLGHFAWCSVNSTGHAQPVGLLKPNDFGLFDMLGNVWEWTNGTFDLYPTVEPIEDNEQVVPTKENDNRVMRGGSWSSSARRVRSAIRYPYIISERNGANGFRVARTMPAADALSTRQDSVPATGQNGAQ